MRLYSVFFKRFFDFVVGVAGALILSPLLILVGLAIKMDSKGPVFFTQERVGQHGKVFRIFKFRTMRVFAESFNPDGTEMENYSRVTKVGRYLRKTSVDELPQLINIVFGDMSIVGPRPTLLYQVERYTEFQKKRLLVKPGLTGLAQVNGRNSLSWEEKIDLDIRYVDELSFFQDLTIVLKTIPVVLKAEKQGFVKHDNISEHSGKVLEDVGLGAAKDESK